MYYYENPEAKPVRTEKPEIKPEIKPAKPKIKPAKPAKAGKKNAGGFYGGLSAVFTCGFGDRRRGRS